MSILFAFLHHAAAFLLVAAIVVEMVSLKGPLTIDNARRLVRWDAIYGASAGVLLAVGFARVIWFEKGAAYYFSNAAFLAKLATFIVVGLLSVYPTIRFFSWRAAVKRGEVPQVDAAVLRNLRMVLHLELLGVALILLFAPMMARGIGS